MKWFKKKQKLTMDLVDEKKQEVEEGKDYYVSISEPVKPDKVQCMAIMKNGQRCKYKAKAGEVYCGVHSKE